ncbi:MAG: transglycosylase SLT domain-containing protein [Bacteroidota bacterium]
MKIFLGLVVITVLVGCAEPNPGFKFAARQAPELGIPTTIETSIGLEELDLRTAESLLKYGPIIQKYAYSYQVDWRLVLAVMKQESSFRPKVVSSKGAYGLMQIMPVTAKEVTEKIGVKNAKSPYNNIKAGIFHLKSLYRHFDDSQGDERIKLSLAAYNAGLNRIKDAQDVARFMGDDPNTWKGVKDALPMLTKRYRTLHARVWGSGSPRAGYFRDTKQTTQYVENIMQSYDGYQLALR